MCKFYSSPADFGAKVSRGLTQLIKRHPSPGWIRTDESNPQQSLEVLQLREENKKLQENLLQLSGLTNISDGLAHGDDVYNASYWYETEQPKINKAGNRWVKGEDGWAIAPLTWDEILRLMAGHLIGDAKIRNVVSALNGEL